MSVRRLATLIKKTTMSFRFIAEIILKVNKRIHIFEYNFTKLMLLILSSVRKSLQRLVPIVRTDNDIEVILNRQDSSITNVLGLFVKSKSSIHLLRAIEPNLRFGAAIKNFVEKSKDIPACELRNTEHSDKCIHIASRKHIGDALVRFEDSLPARN